MIADILQIMPRMHDSNYFYVLIPVSLKMYGSTTIIYLIVYENDYQTKKNVYDKKSIWRRHRVV